MTLPPVPSFSAPDPAFSAAVSVAAAPAPSVAAPTSPASAPAANRTGLFDRAARRRHQTRRPNSMPFSIFPSPCRSASGRLRLLQSVKERRPSPVWKWRVDSEVRREGRFAWLKTAGLAVVAMVVVRSPVASPSPRSARVLPAERQRPTSSTRAAAARTRPTWRNRRPPRHPSTDRHVGA